MTEGGGRKAIVMEMGGMGGMPCSSLVPKPRVTPDSVLKGADRQAGSGRRKPVTCQRGRGEAT